MAKRLKAMRSAGRERQKELAELKEFAAAFKKLKPKAGELQEVNDEISRLSSIEGLTNSAGSASSILNDEENGVLTQLGSARKALEKAATLDGSLANLSDQLSDAFFEIQDIAANLSGYLADLSADPNRLDTLQSRKSELNSFVKRFSKSLSSDVNVALHELIEKGVNIDNELADLEGGDDRIAELELELKKLEAAAVTLATELSDSRTASARKLSKRASEEVHALSMPNTQLVVEVIRGTDFENLTQTGFDEIN